MSRLRNVVSIGIVAAVGCTVGGPTIAAAAPNRSPQESAIVSCHETILDAARTLTSDVEGHLGRCVTHGIDCLTAAGDPSACCARVAERCDDDRSRILEGEQGFENLVARRSCTRVPFSDVLAADGLGFAGAADRCACLTPPVAVDSLAGLATCLRRLIEEDVVQRIALIDAPRTREALACLGLDAEFPAALLDRPSICETCGAATPTASPSAAATPASTGTAAASTQATATAAPTAVATVTVPASSTPFRTPSPTVALPTSSATAGGPTPTVAPTLVATGTPLPGSTGTPLLLPSATSTPVQTSTAPVTTPTRTATPTGTASVTPSPTPPPSICGNGILEGDEQCDGNVIDDTECIEDVCTCDDFCDDEGGTLSCNPDCTVNFSNCTAGGCSF